MTEKTPIRRGNRKMPQGAKMMMKTRRYRVDRMMMVMKMMSLFQKTTNRAMKKMITQNN